MHDPRDDTTSRVRAPFLRRLAAFGVDGIVVALLGFALLAVMTAVVGPTLVLDLDVQASPVAEVRGWRIVLNAALLSALSGAYFVAAWTRYGFTPGQRLLRLEVRLPSSRDGRLPVERAALRWGLLGAPIGLVAALVVEVPLLFLAVSVLSFIWFGILLLTTLFGRDGRGLHDRIAGTTVIPRA